MILILLTSQQSACLEMPFISKTAIVFSYLVLAQNQVQGPKTKTGYLLL